MDNKIVHIGLSTYCVGCGTFMGSCSGIDYGEIEELPEFPFKEDNCPVCYEKEVRHFSVEELAKHCSVKQLQQALMIKRTKKEGGDPITTPLL